MNIMFTDHIIESRLHAKMTLLQGIIKSFHVDNIETNKYNFQPEQEIDLYVQITQSILCDPAILNIILN